MPYLKAHWRQDLPDEAVLWYHELDGERLETRKVVKFRDGRLERADALEQTDYLWLSSEPMPDLGAINSQDEFQAEEIDQQEFEEVWAAASPAKG